jgi:hypothetical protein
VQSSVIVEQLKPVLGKAGQVRLVVRGLNGRWTLNDDKHPLLGVQERPDGLLEFTRDDGWSVLDPGDVLAIEWVSRETEGQGQYL